MALRGDRLVLEADAHSYTLSDVAAKGSVLCLSVAGSGAVLGDTHGTVQLAASPSGLRVAGILLNDFVDIDETRYHVNWHKEEQVIGDVANILKKGWVYTDKVTGTPTDGDTAYLTTSGVVTSTLSTTGGLVATPLVGQFGGKKDQDNFIKLIVNLP
jgi:hypothetical protein